MVMQDIDEMLVSRSSIARMEARDSEECCPRVETGSPLTVDLLSISYSLE
jgi:hypothetical protein